MKPIYKLYCSNIENRCQVLDQISVNLI